MIFTALHKKVFEVQITFLKNYSYDRRLGKSQFVYKICNERLFALKIKLEI